ncbi:hypothetical protein [Streptomyces sp. NBC_01565]|uniref:hypothetical protein n=1 Tax=Streptomyces sp. NBC_01565 TaxID=2975881 RepID=UPI0022522E82|nr:hypothetical protein [Streptomyces sp. NBC_01565]MCX4543820.1 hypothetical protein [Streptomyces sp. NBC_01565]
MNADIPEALANYMIKRDKERADRIAAVWAEFTEREQGLIKDAAVMGWVQGSMSTRAGEQWPGDWVAVPTVLGACLGLPHLYPTITGWTQPEDEEDE